MPEPFAHHFKNNGTEKEWRIHQACKPVSGEPIGIVDHLLTVSVQVGILSELSKLGRLPQQSAYDEVSGQEFAEGIM